MKKDVAIRDTEVMMKDLQNTQKMCQLLMSTPHYKALGAHGIFAIVEKAKSIGVDPMDALNGGMYFVQGKVEMTSAMMNHLIRVCGHSITKDKKSDDTICILHGKRADNGDTWVESFSIDDAKKAGIFRNQWLKYPKDMLFARALSRLARQLFPDVIKGCYVQGEIDESPILSGEKEDESAFITPEEAQNLDTLIGSDEKYRQCVVTFLKKNFGTEDFEEMPRNIYAKVLPVATEKYEQRNKDNSELVYGEEEQLYIVDL